ncbi:MAG: peptidylprolyl isomerase [Candidatus Hydrogenedentes bacterium]|nr:peptidylprolyl isomerase [Candidatus Hydrogenedentota bacterium]
MQKMLTLVTIAALCAGVAYAQDTVPADVVARIGDKETVTKAEFERALSSILQARMAQAKRRGVSDAQLGALSNVSHEEKLKLIDTMVDSKILYMMARDAGIQVTDEEVMAEIDKNKAGLPPSMTFEDFMQRQGVTLDDVKTMTRMRLMAQQFSRDKVKDIAVADEEVQKEYDNLKTRGLFDSADIAHILILVQGTDPTAWDAAKTKIDAAYDRLKKGEDFAAIAKEVSEDDKTKDNGGAINGVMRGILGPEFDERMFTLPAGTLTEPFKSRVGWHILKVNNKSVAPFEGPLKERLTSTILKTRQSEVIGKLVSETRSKLNIQISLPPDAPAPVAVPPVLEGAA